MVYAVPMKCMPSQSVQWYTMPQLGPMGFTMHTTTPYRMDIVYNMIESNVDVLILSIGAC